MKHHTAGAAAVLALPFLLSGQVTGKPRNIAPGEIVRFTPCKGLLLKTALDATKWTYDRQECALEASGAFTNDELLPLDFELNGAAHQVSVWLRIKPDNGGAIIRSVVGFEQAGAAGTQSTQKFFFDFFRSWPVPLWRDRSQRKILGPIARWWGDVRVSSAAQQVNEPLLTFASNFTQRAGALQVNRLAQSAEFLTGLEFRVLSFKLPFRHDAEDGEKVDRVSLGLIGGGGAVGILNPASDVTVHGIPTVDPERALFRSLFLANGPIPPNKSHVAFLQPDRNRFYRQYFAGTRLTVHYFKDKTKPNPSTRPSGMVDLLLGQNEAVTGGRLHRPVFRIDAFYPLPLRSSALDGVVYFFGTAQMAFGKAHEQPRLILAEAPAAMAPHDPAVLQLTQTPSSRDHYRLGIGIDLVRLFTGLAKPPSQ